MEQRIVNLILKTDKDLSTDVSKVRGFIGNEFKEFNLLHNHYGNDYIFTYPKVQYKILDKKICITGINEGGELLKKISENIDFLDLEERYLITEKTITERKFDIKPSNHEIHYKFITPWIALNKLNYKKYRSLYNWKEKKILLNKILIGNILSLSKGFGIIVNRKLYAKSYLNENFVYYKSIKMNAFSGEFKINFELPNYIGIGKGVSHGYGCIKKIN